MSDKLQFVDWSLDIVSSESHQRRWWIVHTQPTFGWRARVPNPTNAVGGSFIPSLHLGWRIPSRIPPTQVVVDLSHDLLTSEPNDKLKFVGLTKENAQ